MVKVLFEIVLLHKAYQTTFVYVFLTDLTNFFLVRIIEVFDVPIFNVFADKIIFYYVVGVLTLYFKEIQLLCS